MPVFVVRRAETLDQVIGRTHGTLSASQLSAVRKATLAANPHVASGETLSPGTVIVVPPRARDTPSAAADNISGDIVNTLHAAIGNYREELAQRIDRADEELAETGRLLESDSFRRAIAQVPGGEEFAGAIERATKETRAEQREAREFVRRDLDALAADVQLLLDKLP